MSACRLTVVGMLAGTLAVALAGPVVAAGWGRPFDLGRSGVRVLDEVISTIATATNGNGAVVVVWPGVRKDGRQAVEVAVGDADGSFAPTRSIDLSRGTVSDPKVAMDPSGEAVIAFTRIAPGMRAPQVMAVPIAADGRPGRARRVSPAGVPAEQPAVGMADDGAATIVFQRDRPFSVRPTKAPPDSLGLPDVVMASSRSAPGRFGPAVVISAPARQIALGAGGFEPAVSMSAAGETIAAWYRNTRKEPPPAFASGRMEAAVAPPGGAFATPAVVATVAEATGRAGTTLTEDAAGNTVLTWQDQTHFDAAGRAAGGAFGAPARFATRMTSENPPAVAFGPNDTAQLVWADCLGPCDGLLSTAHWTPGGPVTAGPSIHPFVGANYYPFGGSSHGHGSKYASYTYSSTPALVFAQGRPVLTWQQLGEPGDQEQGDIGERNIGIEDAIGTPNSALGIARLLSPASHAGPYHNGLAQKSPGGFGGTFLAITLVGGGDGPVYAVWEQADQTVQASRLLMPG